METVAISVCTLDRARLLENCLTSLSNMVLPESLLVNLVVIDNDVKGTSGSVVERFKGVLSFPVLYAIEERKGIPYARNLAIDCALKLNVDYLVFLDDDEQVDSKWLVNLYGYASEKQGKAVVHGAVESILPPETPAHIGSLFKSKTRNTGESLQVCATDNVIIPSRVFRDLELRFDVSQPLAGGTDTKFFLQAVSLGVEIFQCSEALVFEHVPKSRANIRWLSRRKFRAGITEYWRKSQSGKSNIAISISASFHILFGCIKSVLFTLLWQRGLAVRSWLKGCKYFGVLSGLFGVSIDSYKRIDS